MMLSAGEGMADLQREFGRRLRELRTRSGLTQQQLAGRAKMDYKYIGALERGERNPTLFNIDRVAHALGVASGDLLSGKIKAAPPGEVDAAILSNLLSGQSSSTRKKLIELVKVALRLTNKS
jgi:transcriptional regulator with XRE-family HTH domain